MRVADDTTVEFNESRLCVCGRKVSVVHRYAHTALELRCKNGIYLSIDDQKQAEGSSAEKNGQNGPEDGKAHILGARGTWCRVLKPRVVVVANAAKGAVVAFEAVVALVSAPDARAVDRTREEVVVGDGRTPRVGTKLDVGEGAAFLAAIKVVGARKAAFACG